MDFTKRDCGISMKIVPYGYDWTDCDIDFGEIKFHFIISGVMADSIAALIDSLYYLIPENYAMEEQKNPVPYVQCEGVYEDREMYCFPKKAQFSWDGENMGCFNWEIEKLVAVPKLVKDVSESPDFNILIKIQKDCSDKYDCKTTVRYDDLCYALAKACTENLKEYGFQGYYWSQCYEDINIRKLLFIKSVGLRDMRVRDNCKGTDGQVRSSLKDELDLLLFDM